MQKNEYVNLTTGEIKAFYTRCGAWHYFKKDAKKWHYTIKRKEVAKYSDVIVYTTTRKIATILDECGYIGTAELRYEADGTPYIVGADGLEWYLGDMIIIGIREETQTEMCHIDDFVDFD